MREEFDQLEKKQYLDTYLGVWNPGKTLPKWWPISL